MQATTLKDKINLSHAKALRRARELLKVTRSELAQKLNVSPKAIEKYESGRAILDEEKLTNILNALGLKQEAFEKVRRGKSLLKGRKPKTIFKNVQRRSYQKVITKEVRVLRILREMKNLSQDQASSICGYSRPSIGHIENGRMQLSLERITHIVESYGHPMSEFNRLMREELLRDEVLKACYSKMVGLPEEKLKVIQSLLATM